MSTIEPTFGEASPYFNDTDWDMGYAPPRRVRRPIRSAVPFDGEDPEQWCEKHDRMYKKRCQNCAHESAAVTKVRDEAFAIEREKRRNRPCPNCQEPIGHTTARLCANCRDAPGPQAVLPPTRPQRSTWNAPPALHPFWEALRDKWNSHEASVAFGGPPYLVIEATAKGATIERGGVRQHVAWDSITDLELRERAQVA